MGTTIIREQQTASYWEFVYLHAEYIIALTADELFTG